MQTLRSRVTMTIQLLPTPVPPCFADFASKPAWYAPFQILPYLRPAFHVVRQKDFMGQHRWGASDRKDLELHVLFIFAAPQTRSNRNTARRSDSPPPAPAIGGKPDIARTPTALTATRLHGIAVTVVAVEGGVAKADVRFWHKADVARLSSNVRF